MLDQYLVEEFRKTTIADKILQLVKSAELLKGSKAFYNHQKQISQNIATGHAIYEWSLKGRKTVFLMAEKYAQPLAEALDIPIKDTWLQYDAEAFNEARPGHIALGITKETIPTSFMIQKNLVLSAIDPSFTYKNEGNNGIDETLEELPYDVADINEMRSILCALEK